MPCESGQVKVDIVVCSVQPRLWCQLRSSSRLEHEIAVVVSRVRARARHHHHHHHSRPKSLYLLPLPLLQLQLVYRFVSSVAL